MNPSEFQRLNLRESLTTAIGPESTEVLMSSLPPFDWTRIATKDDLEAMEGRITAFFEMRLDARLNKALLGQYRALIGTMVALHAATVGLLAWILR